MLTGVQAFQQTQDGVLLLNKVEIFCQKEERKKILWPLVFTSYKLHWASLVAKW